MQILSNSLFQYTPNDDQFDTFYCSLLILIFKSFATPPNSMSLHCHERGLNAAKYLSRLPSGLKGPGFDSRTRHLNFRDWLSPASKWRYDWNTAKATWIPNTTNRPSGLKRPVGKPRVAGSILSGDTYSHFDFSLVFRSLRIGGALTNGIKHDHSPAVIVVSDPR